MTDRYRYQNIIRSNTQAAEINWGSLNQLLRPLAGVHLGEASKEKNE